MTTSRPGYFPSVFAWLTVGVGRNWRGVLAALVSTWFYLPFAIFMAAFSAILLGVLGVVGGTVGILQWVPAEFGQVPLLGPAIEAVLPRVSGILGGVIGVFLGLVLGFLGALLLYWWIGFSDDPVAGFGSMLGVVVVGLALGLLYTLYRITFEAAILRAAGVRRMSRRERELLIPVARNCARRLGLSDHPAILIDDGREPSATAYTRHLVVSRGLLEEFDYDPQVLGGVVSHLLVHWRNGDAVGAAFVRGVALPLYGIYAAVRWITRRAESKVALAFAMGPLTLLAWTVFWPVVVTVRGVIMPIQASDTRRAEFRADQGAVRAGYRDGLRRVLDQLDHTFEGGRNGWEQAVCATHPPNELRLERLEDPADAGGGPG